MKISINRRCIKAPGIQVWGARSIVVRKQCCTVRSAIVREQGEEEAGPEGHHIFGRGKNGHLHHNCPTMGDQLPKEEKLKSDKLGTQGEF